MSKNQDKIIFNRRLIHTNNDLTFIVGFRATDGVVIVADQKITRASGNVNYEMKVFSDLNNIVYAAAGPTGLFDKFRKKISEVSNNKTEEYASNPELFIEDVEDIVTKLNEKYVERTNYQALELIVGLGQRTVPTLEHITPSGVGQMIRNYQVIGSGQPYGSLFLKMAWNKNELNMAQCGALGYFIIKIIEENELDSYVGIGKNSIPHIVFIPTAPEDYNSLSEEEQKQFNIRLVVGDELDHIEKIVDQEYDKFQKYFEDDFINLFRQTE